MLDKQTPGMDIYQPITSSPRLMTEHISIINQEISDPIITDKVISHIPEINR
jgi:hypothetical protein